MKRLLFIFALLGFVLTAESQATKIHTFNHSVTPAWLFSENTQFFNSCYLYLDGNTYYMYNWDFTLKGSFEITQIPEGYEVFTISHITKKCFNNDDKYEFVVRYKKPNPTYSYPECNSNSKMWVVNEDNQLVYDFGEAYSINFSGFHKNGNELRCMVNWSILNEDNTISAMYDIYRCDGNGGASLKVNEFSMENTMPAYPNPAVNSITLPYNLSSNSTSEMHIYDMQGRLVKTMLIGPHFHEISLDVSSFSGGTYIYEYEGISNKFVVQ